LRSRWLVLLLYGVLAVAMTWPVVAQLGSHVPGGTSDLWVHQWTFWWVKKSLIAGQSPLHTDLLFYPQGVSLAYQNMAWLNIAAWLPLQAILGATTAYSLIYLTVFVLNAFSMYLLACDTVDSAPAAIVAGVVFGFWPYTLSHYGHPNMMVVFGVPLALLCLKRVLAKGRLRDALLAAVFTALTGIARWQLLIMATIMIGLYVLWHGLTHKTCWTRRSLGLLALSGLGAAALMAPLAAPVVGAYLNQSDPGDVLIGDETSGQTDLLAYILPTRYHPLWNDAAAEVYDNFVDNKVYVPFLGYSVLVIALCGAIRDWKRARLWVLLAVVYMILALGAQLRINGRLYPWIPMPYRFIDDLLVVRVLRNPDRFNALLGLPVGMLTALGIAPLVPGETPKPKLVLIEVVVIGVILVEYSLVPYHTEHPVTPGWYEQLAREPGEFGVLDLPMRPETYDKQYMFYQITHEKPLVEGHVSRPPDGAYAFMDAVPLLQGLRRDNVMDPALVNVTRHLGPLAEADIRYVILHKDFASSQQLLAWQDWLTFDPLHEDEHLVVYRTDPGLDEDFTLTAELTKDVGLLRATVDSPIALQGAVIHVDARWGSTAPPDRDYDVCLDLARDGHGVAQSHCVPLSASWPTSQWAAEEIVRSRYALQIPESLAPGQYELSLALADSAGGAGLGKGVTVSRVQVDALRPMQPLEVRLGQDLLLRGYDLIQSDQSLQLTLYWQAQREMVTSYKVFVHLVESTSEEIVAQDDAVPRRWTYPTTKWQSGEVVKDTVRLPLGDIPSGEYRLRVGCYRDTTGERLPIYGADGQSYTDDVLPLAIVRH